MIFSPEVFGFTCAPRAGCGGIQSRRGPGGVRPCLLSADGVFDFDRFMLFESEEEEQRHK